MDSASEITRRAAAKTVGVAAISGLVAATDARAVDPAGIYFLSACELARAIRFGRLSARDVVAAHLAQVERVNPRVNAIVTLVAEQALAQAARADELQASGQQLGPLHGLPVVIKDLHDTQGIRTTYGSRIFADHVPAADTLHVQRMRAAGAIILGKSNTPEFGAGSQTFNAVFGATRNPYDLSKTCGGSSGGAAVALATGMVPLADGSDMGGSLRNPASFCNVVGFRTTPGRVPSESELGWFGLSVPGPMARSVSDVALLLSVLAGPDQRSPLSIAEPGSLFAAPLTPPVKGLRIAWAKDLGGLPFNPRVTAAVNAHKATFQDLGCVVEDAEPDFSGADQAFKTLRAWSFESSYHQLLERHRGLIKDTVIGEIERGAKLTGPDIARAEAARTALYQRFRRFFERYDYFVLPVSQVPPFDLNQPYVTEVAGTPMSTYIDWMRSCYFISLTGNPSIAVPAGFTPEGLPVGLQIVGPQRAELALLQIAHAFESATGFAKKHPAL